MCFLTEYEIWSLLMQFIGYFVSIGAAYLSVYLTINWFIDKRTEQANLAERDRILMNHFIKDYSNIISLCNKFRFSLSEVRSFLKDETSDLTDYLRIYDDNKDILTTKLIDFVNEISFYTTDLSIIDHENRSEKFKVYMDSLLRDISLVSALLGKLVNVDSKSLNNEKKKIDNIIEGILDKIKVLEAIAQKDINDIFTSK